MTLNELQADLNTALKSGQAVKVATLRLLISAVRNAGIAKYGNEWEMSLNETDVVDVVKRQIKTHRESIEAFSKAGRNDLVEKEQGELSVLETYGPKEMSDTDLERLLKPIAASGETNFGLLMKNAMTAVAGQADGGRVSAALKRLLAG